MLILSHFYQPRSLSQQTRIYTYVLCECTHFFSFFSASHVPPYVSIACMTYSPICAKFNSASAKAIWISDRLATKNVANLHMDVVSVPKPECLFATRKNKIEFIAMVAVCKLAGRQEAPLRVCFEMFKCSWWLWHEFSRKICECDVRTNVGCVPFQLHIAKSKSKRNFITFYNRHVKIT